MNSDALKPSSPHKQMTPPWLEFRAWCALFVLVFAAATTSDAKKSTASKINPSQFCSNYAGCLQRLEAKQRECLRYPADAMDLRGSSSLRAAADANANTTLECTKRKRKDLHRELAELHLRKTEVVRDCITKNTHRARSILNPQRERKCLANTEKLTTFTEILKGNGGSGNGGNKAKRVKADNGKTKISKSKRKPETTRSGASSAPPTPTTTTAPKANGPASSNAADGSTLGGFAQARRAKRKAALANGKKQSAKLCKRAKKSVVRKCHQISKCCSIVSECQLLADTIDDQIVNLKMELKSPTCAA